MKELFQFIKKHFWEKWIWGVSTLLIILGIQTFLIDTLKKEVSISSAWIVLLFLVILGLCWGIFVERAKQSTNEKKRPVYLDYNNDIFDGCKYEWVWNYDDKKRCWYLGPIITKCLACNFEMVNGFCQKCDSTSMADKSREDIRAYIRYEVEKRFDIRGIEIT